MRLDSLNTFCYIFGSVGGPVTSDRTEWRTKASTIQEKAKHSRTELNFASFAFFHNPDLVYRCLAFRELLVLRFKSSRICG